MTGWIIGLVANTLFGEMLQTVWNDAIPSMLLLVGAGVRDRRRRRVRRHRRRRLGPRARPTAHVVIAVLRCVHRRFRFRRRLAHGSPRVTMSTVAMVVVAACGGTSGGDTDGALPPLLSVEQLGEGWVASDPGDVALLPGTVAPPCPFEGEIPDVEVAAADSIEFGDEERQLGINHTVVELDGDAESAQAVLATWESMDCSGSDADQRPVEGLPDGVFGVELDTIDSDFTQAVLVRVDGRRCRSSSSPARATSPSTSPANSPR